MKLPPVFSRGRVLYADLRAEGGSRAQSLGLPVGTPEIAVGVALGRVLEALRAARGIGAPELPGLAEPGLTLAQLVGMYVDGRDYDTDGGRSSVVGLCRRIVKGIGHVPVSALVAPGGEVVLRAWRDRLWGAGLAGRSINDLLYQTLAVLRWGRSEGRRLTGPLPAMPKACRPGEILRNPVFAFWTEADFRVLRAHAFDEALRTGGMAKHFGKDRTVWAEYIARRQLYLSWGFYAGLHTADLDGLPACWVSVAMGRYERHNTKSATVVGPAWFDMPEQLRLDCQAELDRLGRPWRTVGHRPMRDCPCERIAGGPWAGASRMLAKATARLWPQAGGGSTLPAFQFRLARRSTVREYTIRGWKIDEIAAIMGHVDCRMIAEVYRRMNELGLISPVRVPWTVRSGPEGSPTRTATVHRLVAV